MINWVKKQYQKLKEYFSTSLNPPTEFGQIAENSEEYKLLANISSYLMSLQLQYYSEEIANGKSQEEAIEASRTRAIDFYNDQVSDAIFKEVPIDRLYTYCTVQDVYTYEIWKRVVDKYIQNERYEEAAIVRDKIKAYESELG